MCHHNSFLIYESLVDANAKRWNFVTHVSVLFSMACSLILGVTGYSTFTGFTQGTRVLGQFVTPSVRLRSRVVQGRSGAGTRSGRRRPPAFFDWGDASPTPPPIFWTEIRAKVSPLMQLVTCGNAV